MPRKKYISKDSQTVADIIERRNESQKFMQQEIWGEVTEVWRGIKCRTAKVYKKDKFGRKTKEEDKSRSNVAMPTLSIMHRHNVARMTAQPYKLRYIGGEDPTVAQSLTALEIQQYSHSDEPMNDFRLVMAGEAFGWAYMDLGWVKIAPMVKLRKAFVLRGKVVYRDRASIMQAQGAPSDEIQGAVDQLGPDMRDEEIAQAMQKLGNEITVPTEIGKYEGPQAKWIFNGDAFIEPGCLTVDDSSYWIKQYRQTDLWLTEKLELTYKDEDGKDVPVFDPDCIDELLDKPSTTKQKDSDLRDMMLGATGRQTSDQYRYPARLEIRKKYDIVEQHAQGADGRMWITWVAENYGEKALGTMPYPWDLCGKFTATEYVPMPDMITCYGDSTPRLLRYLYSMHNRTVGQNFDYVSNSMKPFILKQRDMEVDNDVSDRGNWRELSVENINQVKPMQENPLPPGAMQREAQQLQMMALAEPSMTSVDAGTASNPQAGKTATTAILSAKKQDALTQAKLYNRDIYLRSLGYKKLRMNQQQAKDKWVIGSEYFTKDMNNQFTNMPPAEKKFWGLTESNGKVVSIELDPLEAQNDYRVEPEAGSYLAVDDELNRSALMDLQAVAAQNPGIINQRAVAQKQLSSIRNIGNAQDYLLPEGPPPPPEIKKSVSITYKGELLPAEITNQLLGESGLQPSEELAHRDTLKGIMQAAEAAKAVDDMTSPENTHSFVAQSKKEELATKAKPNGKGKVN